MTREERHAAQVAENEKKGRDVVTTLFKQIREFDDEFNWGFTTYRYEVYDGYTNNSIFDVKVRDIYNKYTHNIYPTIYLATSKADEMNKIAKTEHKNSLYLCIDATNNDIYCVNLLKCNDWKRSVRYLQLNNTTKEKGWVNVYIIPTNEFTVFAKDEKGKYYKKSA